MLTGVATGVRKDAADAATEVDIRTGWTATPSSSRGGDRDGDHDQRRRHVADELAEDGGDDEQAGQQRVRPEAARRRRRARPPTRSAAPVSIIAVDSGIIAGHEDDRRPGDGPVGALDGHDCAGRHGARREQPGDGRRDDPGHEQDDHPGQDDDGLRGAQAERHGLAADELGRVDDEHARVVEVLVERRPRALEQERRRRPPASSGRSPRSSPAAGWPGPRGRRCR